MTPPPDGHGSCVVYGIGGKDGGQPAAVVETPAGVGVGVTAGAVVVTPTGVGVGVGVGVVLEPAGGVVELPLGVGVPVTTGALVEPAGGTETPPLQPAIRMAVPASAMSAPAGTRREKAFIKKLPTFNWQGKKEIGLAVV